MGSKVITGHAPGPWRWWSPETGRPAKYDLCRLISGDTSAVLSCYGGSGADALGDSKRARANAALIASAPDLLAFVERWKSIVDGGAKSAEGWARDFDTEARDLLAKAHGAS